MKLIITTIVLSIAAALALAASAQAAGLGADLDPRTRAKLAKAKAKTATELADNFNFLDQGQKKADCGSQSVGNVNLNGQAGTGPREIFVFAPNAINIVGPRGCQ